MNAPAAGLIHRTFPLIFAAPSGAGKTSIVERLLAKRDDLVFSVSMTTRPARGYEREGEHYHFVSEADFRRRAVDGELLEWAEVHGHLYGTPRRNLAEAVACRQYLVLDIDIQGARQVRQKVPEAVTIFVLPPSGVELAQRLVGRGSEDPAVRRRRLSNALAELRAAGEFDYVIVNGSLEESVAMVETILDAEAHRTRRLPGLLEEVTRLGSEIGGLIAERAEPPTS